MSPLDYRDLRVWTAAIEIAVLAYSITSAFPRSESFGITAQMRRAAISVASSIAEGNARSSTRDFLRFLSIARGSLAELDTQFVIAARLGYVDGEVVAQARRSINGIARMLKRLEQVLCHRLALSSR